ncbi:MAG: hypothetical protein AAF922_11525 [Pseudomonadota bacterium]
MNTIELLPYGVFAGRYRTREGANDVMADWFPIDPDRVAKFQTWRNKQLAFIKDAFFPENTPGGKSMWDGAAAKFASEVTKKELAIMVEELGFSHDAATALQNSVLHQTPSFGASQNAHLHHYVVEDDITVPAGENFLEYDPSLTQEEHTEMKKLAAAALGEAGQVPTKGAGLFWFKFRLVRPRPFQAAHWFATPNFTCEIANTGFHSSAPSGHCLQGILLGCAVLEGWIAEGFDMSSNPNRVRALAQYMIDWGDRRILAGVHYPTDNVISWWLTMQLVPEIFSNPTLISQFVSYAIQEHSEIYRIVDSNFDDGALSNIRKTLQDALPDFEPFTAQLEPSAA